MDKIKLALDWTPNANHIGFLTAQANGYYQAEHIDVAITSPADDNYQVTPAKKVELGQADFALCPMESVVSYRTKANPFPLQAVATIFKEDVSAIAVLEESGISRPKDLDGKHYASYQARYEDEIVRQMIRNDGGAGSFEISYPDKLGIWETLLMGKADATWIFTNWEGIEAAGAGIKLRLFKMKDFSIPYSYSPVLAAGEKQAKDKEAAYRNFLSASKKGFVFASEHPEEAAKILRQEVPEKDSKINLQETIECSSQCFGDLSRWGKMDIENVSEYVQWLSQHGLEDQVRPEELFTNELL